jgi:hypothetical protein
MKKITITIDTEGQTQIEAHGHQGGTCTKATAPLTKALLGGTATDTKKPEYYQGDATVQVRQTE